MDPQLTVFYNTKCPVCNFGIGKQKQKLVAAAKDGRILFRDINLEPEALMPYGSDLAFVRKRLHALDANGKLYIGTEAFAEIWRRTPGEEWLASIVRMPVIAPLARWSYNGFAEVLYLWNRLLRHW